MKTWICLALTALLAGGFPLAGQCKGYSSGSHSYSSSSHSSSFGGSHSFGSGGSSSHSSSFGGGGGGSHSFTSGGGKSYSSGSVWSGESRKSYSSGKSYGAGSHHSFSPGLGGGDEGFGSSFARKRQDDSGFNFDTAAARARKEEASKQDFTRFKEAHNPPPVIPTDRPRAVDNGGSYRATPPPMMNPGYGRTRVYIPDITVISTRRARMWNVFNPYWNRPAVVYRDSYSSFFWWWLLDQSLEDRAWWAYHHRYDMDPARYQALVATDQQLEARVQQLEAQQAVRDPSAVPAGLDRDLMYSDQYVARAYSNRPTMLGTLAFWALGIPAALAVSVFIIWLIWFKRWQTAT